MKRMIIPMAVLVLLLASCATRPPRPQELAFSVESRGEQTLLTLPLGRDALIQAGYREGDWIDLIFDGVVLRVRFAANAMDSQATLVAFEERSIIYLPTALIKAGQGVLSIARPEQGTKTSLHLSGSFVFTF